MSLLMSIGLVVQVLSAIALIVLVLLQHGKGADLGAAFGSGASGAIFGAAGSGSSAQDHSLTYLLAGALQRPTRGHLSPFHGLHPQVFELSYHTQTDL